MFILPFKMVTKSKMHNSKQYLEVRNNEHLLFVTLGTPNTL